VNSILTFLFDVVYRLLAKIEELESLIEKLTPIKPNYDFNSPKYKRLTVDKPPIVRHIQKLDYKKLIIEHQTFCGKIITPVRRRGDSHVKPDAVCPYCDAPHGYLYDNDGGRGQLLCKVC
jgi:hypothetical protein